MSAAAAYTVAYWDRKLGEMGEAKARLEVAMLLARDQRAKLQLFEAAAIAAASDCPNVIPINRKRTRKGLS